MDRLPWAPVPLGFPAVLGLWEGGTGARGVEVYLGDLPDDEPVLEGLDWYWKNKRGYLINRNRTSSVATPHNEERKVGSLIAGVAPVFWVLQLLRNEGIAFALQSTTPSRGLE